ncbi:hypothetical protein HDV02_000192 [Globomyces sp. JEL0801]|nr:hypothetical protein HDV02_000192 [Globomyces sp. JEL0801]
MMNLNMIYDLFEIIKTSHLIGGRADEERYKSLTQAVASGQLDETKIQNSLKSLDPFINGLDATHSLVSTVTLDLRSPKTSPGTPQITKAEKFSENVNTEPETVAELESSTLSPW